MKSTSTERLLEWSEKIKRQKLSNMGVAAWCSEQNISPNTFQYWKKKNQSCISAIAQKKFIS